MSKIVKIDKVNSDSSRNVTVAEVNCKYEHGVLPDGTPCVILKTYNPKSQKSSVSQTLHITKEVAMQLIDILKTELHI